MDGQSARQYSFPACITYLTSFPEAPCHRRWSPPGRRQTRRVRVPTSSLPGPIHPQPPSHSGFPLSATEVGHTQNLTLPSRLTPLPHPQYPISLKSSLFPFSKTLLSSPPFLKLFYFFFNWRIITLQYGVSFCHTLTWVSYRDTCVPSLLNFPPSPTPSHTSRLSQSPRFELPASHSHFPLAVCFIYGNVYVSMLLFQFYLPLCSPSVYTSLFSMFASPLLPCK